MTQPLLLNGRFLTRSVTGVDRVAEELSAALSKRSGIDLSLALPTAPIVATETRPETVVNLRREIEGGGNKHLWEQFRLARAANDRWLLSLCNTGPVLRSRQAVMIHDAQVFTQPESYSAAFRAVYHALLPRLARKADVVMTVSEYSRSELEGYGVVPEGKAVVVPNGADHFGRIVPDPEAIERFGLSGQRFILAIGSLAPHKNLSMLTDALTARADLSVPLVVAGGGNSAVFKDAGLPEEQPGLRYLGRVTNEELAALYASATVLAFPSLTEGFGLPPLEAMSMGCPVVASTGGAVPEVCGEAALYADPRKPEDWVAAVDKVLSDPELEARLSAAGRARAAEFTWDRSADVLLNAIGAAA